MVCWILISRLLKWSLMRIKNRIKNNGTFDLNLKFLEIFHFPHEKKIKYHVSIRQISVRKRQEHPKWGYQSSSNGIILSQMIFAICCSFPFIITSSRSPETACPVMELGARQKQAIASDSFQITSSRVAWPAFDSRAQHLIFKWVFRVSRFAFFQNRRKQKREFPDSAKWNA